MPTKKSPAKKTTKSAVKKTASKKSVKKATKVAKKAPAKKAATKKTAAKKAAPKKKPSAMKKPVKDLVLASDQESFWVHNGDILNSLLALRDALAEMEKDIYQYHAKGEQNDFALWVETVLCDDDCAADLQKAKTQKGARTVVVKHLKLYSI